METPFSAVVGNYTVGIGAEGVSIVGISFQPASQFDR
jgi:hypothetical protein